MRDNEKYAESLKTNDQSRQVSNPIKSDYTCKSDYSEALRNNFDSFYEKNNFNIKNCFDSIPYSAAITTVEGEVMFINSTFTQLFELTLQDVAGKTIESFLDPRKTKFMFGRNIYSFNTVRTGKIYVSYMKKGLYSGDNLAAYIVMFHNTTTQVKEHDFLDVMHNVSMLAINNGDDMKNIYPLIVKELRKIWDISNLSMALYNKEEQKVSFPFSIDGKESFDEVSIEQTVIGYVINKNKSFLLKEDDLKALEDAGKIKYTRNHCKVCMCAPLQINDEPIGVMCLQDYQSENKFSIEDLNMLGFIANHIATIIHRGILVAAQNKAEENVQRKQFYMSTMSHEIRTPLNEILGITNLLIEKHPTEDQIDLITALKFSGDHLLQFINDILDINKIESKKIVFEHVSFDIDKTLDEIVKIYSLRANEKNLTLELIKDPQLPKEVIGDPVRLNQILLNLLSNAIKFTNEGGIKITINVLPKTEKQMNLEFIISDTGIGIPKEKHAIIFESYEQVASDTTRKYGGSGLGLTISKSLIELQGGSLTFISDSGKGTTFAFVLPFNYAAKSSAPQKAETADNFSTSLEGKKILVAEDNKINFFVVNKFLTGWGIKVTHAENGQFALDKLKENEFDLILMDLQMPVMDGIEASKIIRNSEDQHTSSIPIIALTAAMISENQEKFTDLLINDYILKPFKPHDLFERIMKHIR